VSFLEGFFFFFFSLAFSSRSHVFCVVIMRHLVMWLEDDVSQRALVLATIPEPRHVYIPVPALSPGYEC
jgi:hypothetical protein